MNDKEIDQVLAERFKKMRSSEMVSVPDFPDKSRLMEHQATSVKNTIFYRDQSNSVARYLPQIAASFVLLAIVSIFITNTPEEDPAEIYAEIMKNHQSMATDHLLIVSESLLPAMNTVPEFYNTDLNLGIDQATDFGSVLETQSEIYTN